MKRCSLRAWIPLLPWPVWPLAGQVLLGQHVVVGSMTLLLAVRGNMATRSMSGPPFAFQLHHTTVWCGATRLPKEGEKQRFLDLSRQSAQQKRRGLLLKVVALLLLVGLGVGG